jgi:creatinine amidohydrolase
MYWDQLTSPNFAALKKRTPVVLPISATEQHGPHLPLATDRMIVEHFCQRLHETIPDDVLILPTIAVGCSEHHLSFSGSLSVRHDTLTRQLKDLCTSVLRHGFRNILILNSHGGNQGAGQVFLESFGFRHSQCRLVFASWWRIAAEEIRSFNEGGFGGVGHAGEFETSLMLLIAPHLVRQDSIEPRANIATFDWAEADLLRSPRATLYRTFSGMTRNGALGDPALASREKGEWITAAVMEELVKIIMDLRQ